MNTERRPNNHDIRHLLLRLFKPGGLIPARALLIAVSLALTACGSANQDKYTLRDEGIELYDRGDFAGAREKFSEALDASEGEVSKLQYDILKYKAECELRSGDITAAKESYEVLLALDKDAGDQTHYEEIMSELENLDLISQANEHFEDGDYESAADIYRKCALLDGSVSGRIAWFDLAVAEEYMGDFDEAASLFEQYLSVYPDDEAASKEARFSLSRGGQTDG